MTYSLLTVYKQDGNTITGYWVQDHIGTIETALLAAQRTQQLNRGSVIAVVDCVGGTTPMLDGPYTRERLA